MKNFPITYNVRFELYPEELRRCMLREFALNGARHLVLEKSLITMTMEKPALLGQIASEMAVAGLSFKDSHAPYGPHWDLGCAFEEERPALMLRLKTAIETAAFFNVDTMTMHLGKRAETTSEEKYFSLICSSLDQLLPLAEERRVTLCVENSFAWRGFPETLFKIREKFPDDSLGFCFDAGHANMTTQPETLKKAPADTVEILSAMLPHIVNCHIHDNDGMHDHHDLPGRGCAQWQTLIPLLKSAPRLQVIQSEVHTAQNGVVVRELVETFDKFFN